MKRKKQEPNASPALAGLTLFSDIRQPLISFPETVVRPLRRMATLLVANGKLPPRLALVSALREEGVTYTSLALAAILAHDTAKNVGLLELNWQWPGLARLIMGQASGDPLVASSPRREAPATPSDDPIAVAESDLLGVPASAPLPGDQHTLAAVLAERAALNEAVLWTGLPNLAILLAGQVPIQGREALARGPRLSQIVDQLGEIFDYLVLDIPALAATSDAIPLARLADASLLVVRQGVTPRRVVASALVDLGAANVLGTILNRAQVATPRWILRLIPHG